MKKIFLAFILTFCVSIPSFAQTSLMTQASNNMLMMAAMEDGHQQQAQTQAPIVVQIQYQADGTPVVTTSHPNAQVTLQTAKPAAIQDDNPEYLRLFEIILAFVFGCFVGPIITGMYKSTKIKK